MDRMIVRAAYAADDVPDDELTEEEPMLLIMLGSI